MGTFQDALAALAALEIPGVARHYALDDVPDRLLRPQLPALIILPGDLPERRTLGERGGGLGAIAFAGAARTVELRVTHLLLVGAVESGFGAQSHLAQVVALIDAYLEVISADLRLGDRLLEPMQISIEPGEFERGGGRFHGAAFRHRWLITPEEA